MCAGGLPDEEGFCFEKRSVKGSPEAMEPRRGRGSESGTEMGSDERSFDMARMEGEVRGGVEVDVQGRRSL